MPDPLSDGQAPSETQTPPKPAMMLDGRELRRMQSLAERKGELERIIVDSTIAIRQAEKAIAAAADELIDNHRKFNEMQTSVAMRFGIVGPYNITPEGVVVPLGG